MTTTYRVEIKTNYADYRTIASGLNSKSEYSYDLSSIALDLSAGEYVTDIRMVFDVAAAGMRESMAPCLYVTVLPDVVNGFQLINRAEVGCQGTASSSVSGGSGSANTGISGINNGWTGSSSQSTTTVTAPIRTITPDVPDYDGRPNEEHMLRNRMLNAATFYFLQQAAAGYGNMEAERQWAKAMYNGKLIAAVENSPQKNYPSISVRNKDRDALLLYTDWRQMGADFDMLPAGLIVNYGDLRQILHENKNVVFLLNQSTCHLIVDMKLLDTIKELATGAVEPGGTSSIGFGFGVKGKGFTLGQVAEDEWDKIDPTPDFLK